MVTTALQQQVLVCQTSVNALWGGSSPERGSGIPEFAATFVGKHAKASTGHQICRVVGRRGDSRPRCISTSGHCKLFEAVTIDTHVVGDSIDEDVSKQFEDVDSAVTGKGEEELEGRLFGRLVLDFAIAGTLLGIVLTGHASNAWADGMPSMASMPDNSDLGFFEWLGEMLFSIGQEANGLVKNQLATGITFGSAGVIFGAGLVTSFSPCTLSVLPLTIGYIGGYDQSKSRANVVIDSLAFSLGLASTLAGLGVVASVAGRAYGQIGQGLPIGVSIVAILMGLNLLEVISLQLPSFFGNFNAKEAAAGFPSSVQAYLAGLTFALAASPCSTPVLATLLSYVASTQDPVRGGGLLLAYTTGYVSPLLLAASFTGALKQLLSLRQYSRWINPTSGALLLGGGVYSLLTRTFPDSSMMMMDMAM